MASADTSKILGKLREFNDSATGDGMRLTDNQLQEINELIEGNTSNLEAKMNVCSQLMKWPIGTYNHSSHSLPAFDLSLASDKIFPVLDVVRLIVLNSDVCKYLFENDTKASAFLSQLFTYLHPEQSANIMLIFRTLTNLFSNDLAEKYLIKNSRPILAKTLIYLPLSKKNAQVALTNVILNYCIYAYRSNDQQLSSYLYDCYKDFIDIGFESEGAKRLLLGLGTLFRINADLVLDVQTAANSSAKRFFTALEKSAPQLNADTLECLERCRELAKTL